MFSRCFRRPKRAKVKVFLNLGLKSGAKREHFVGFCGCVPRCVVGLVGELVGASVQVVRHPTKIAYFLPPWCNRFLASVQQIRFKGVLRGFIWVYGVQMYI